MSQHLTIDEIAAWQTANELGESPDARISDHLDSCTSCRQRVFAADECLNSFVSALSEADEFQSLSRGGGRSPVRRYGAAVMGLAALVGVVSTLAARPWSTERLTEERELADQRTALVRTESCMNEAHSQLGRSDQDTTEVLCAVANVRHEMDSARDAGKLAGFSLKAKERDVFRAASEQLLQRGDVDRAVALRRDAARIRVHALDEFSGYFDIISEFKVLAEEYDDVCRFAERAGRYDVALEVALHLRQAYFELAWQTNLIARRAGSATGTAEVDVALVEAKIAATDRLVARLESIVHPPADRDVESKDSMRVGREPSRNARSSGQASPVFSNEASPLPSDPSVAPVTP